MKKYAALAIVALTLSGCSTFPTADRTTNYAIAGGTAGAVIGAVATGNAGGAIIGGSIGAVTGALIAQHTPPYGY